MFRKGGLSQETGIMSGLDRRGYAQGSYAPRVGYADGTLLDKLKSLYWLWHINKKYNKLSFVKNIKSVLLISISSIKKYGFK